MNMGFFSTVIVLLCASKENKKALSALLKGLCAQDWITFSDLFCPTRGLQLKSPGSLRSPCDFSFVRLAKQALHAAK
jgi:hypothetical protein